MEYGEPVLVLVERVSIPTSDEFFHRSMNIVSNGLVKAIMVTSQASPTVSHQRSCDCSQEVEGSTITVRFQSD
jgi:hypothetical protein